MSKRSSKLKRVSDSIEEVFIELLRTVVRDHKGNVVYFSAESIDVYNKCYDEFSKILEKNDFLTIKEKDGFINKFNEIQNNLPYLDD